MGSVYRATNSAVALRSFRRIAATSRRSSAASGPATGAAGVGSTSGGCGSITQRVAKQACSPLLDLRLRLSPFSPVLRHALGDRLAGGLREVPGASLDVAEGSTQLPPVVRQLQLGKRSFDCHDLRSQLAQRLLGAAARELAQRVRV